MSCASWMGRTLLSRVASGTKLLGVSSNQDIEKDLRYRLGLMVETWTHGIELDT